MQFPGRPRQPLTDLPWPALLTTYRPFLSYSELGKLVHGRPSEMFDVLQAILGLEPVLEAERRLADAAKERDRRDKAAKPLSECAKRVAARLAAWPRRTATQEELWQLLDAADPTSAGQPSRRALLATVVAELAAAGLVQLPSADRLMDRTAQPPLPQRITLLSRTPPAMSPRQIARNIAWRPELAWAATAELTRGQLATLQQLNVWFRDAKPTRDVPMRERSLEIFGDEKALDRLVRSALFSPMRLSLAQLRAYRSRPPLPAIRVGDGHVLLVVENSDTFDTMVRRLDGGLSNVRHVAWGAGAAFEASVASIGRLPGITAVSYFGDVDADGLRFPTNAATLATELGLPPIEPAASLYQMLFERGHPAGDGQRVDATRAIALAAWLPADMRVAAVELLTSGQRLAQEAVGTELLARAPWPDDLRTTSG